MDLVLVVAVVQHRVEVQVVDLGDRGDVAGNRLRDLDVVLALELEQVPDLERLLAVVDEQLRVLLHRALVDAEDAELADEGIVDDLEHVGDDVRLPDRAAATIGCAVVAAALDEGRRIGLRRDAGTAVSAMSSSSFTPTPVRAETKQIGTRWPSRRHCSKASCSSWPGQAVLAVVEVMVHHRFVDLDDLVDDLLVPVGDRAEVAVAGWLLPKQSTTRLAAVGGQVDRQALRAEGLAQLVEQRAALAAAS